MMELWPFTNFHDLNLDWIIETIKVYTKKVDDLFDTGLYDYVEQVLAAHPEWTTTVQDGAISFQKLDDYLQTVIESVDKQSNLKFALYEGNDHLILRLTFDTFEFKAANANAAEVSSMETNKFVTNGGLSYPRHKYTDEAASAIEYGTIYTTGTGLATISNGVLNYTTNLNDTSPDIMIPAYPAVRLNNADYDFSTVQTESVQGLNQYVTDYVLEQPHNRLIIAQRNDASDIEMFIIFGRVARWPGATNSDLQTIFRNYKTAIMLDGGGSVQLGFNGAQLLPNQNRSLSIRTLPNVCILGG